MSEDEDFVLIVSGIVSLACWGRWYWLATVARMRPGTATLRATVFIAPAAALLASFAIIRTLSSHDVRDDPKYIGFYLVLATAWLGIGQAVFPLFGVNVRDDVLERANGPACWEVGGALLGLACCFGGGNVGDGPGWWVVVFCAGLATLAYAAVWRLLDLVGRLSEVVTIERDLASGIRLAGALVAAGIILGRAVAGDWHSVHATVADFVRLAWPVLLLLVIAAVLDRWLRPTAERTPAPALGCGVLPATTYVICAGMYVVATGMPT